MTTIALLGGGGFIGSRVRDALEARGADVRSIVAPRLVTPARDMAGLMTELNCSQVKEEAETLRRALVGCRTVVNAAGVADAAGGGDVLFGANALMPGLIGAASPDSARVLHLSSAAVLGRGMLDESRMYAPFSSYSAAKTLGERIVLRVHAQAVCYRPTSVHGRGRAVTDSLVRLLRSPAASVAGDGTAPTPQVLLENVADAAAFLSLTTQNTPPIVLHPWEGMTTGGLVRVVGRRRPKHVPTPVARSVVSTTRLVGHRSGALTAMARRLEMLWFGQHQETGWLTDKWTPPVGLEGWRDLA